MLESLTTAPVQELGGVHFTYRRNSTDACELHNDSWTRHALWTGELFQLHYKRGGVDAVAITTVSHSHGDNQAELDTSRTATASDTPVIYLIQVCVS